MKLSELLYGVSVVSVSGSTAVEPVNITTDSRQVREGSLFIAVRGTRFDGHTFIEQALQQGAIAIVAETLPTDLATNKTYVQVANATLASALIASHFYGDASSRLRVVGVTGTNGKTTIATLLYKLFSSLGHTCGLISTVENRIGDRSIPSTHTTPDPIQLQQLLQQMEQAGCTHVFMEVSSHAIHQHRIAGIQFAGGIFSNITHDHLDYHKTFDEYIRVKKSFFDVLPATAFALSNADDKRGAVMLQNCKARHLFYALRTLADYKGRLLDNGLEGLQLSIDEVEVHFRLIGTFNAYNLLAVYGAACAMGLEKIEVLTQLSQLQGAPGRFECIVSPNEQLLAVVDYAHTPDALLNVLTTLKQLRKPEQKLTTVTGCGGDRDRTKRPLMAAAVAAHSDRFIFTSDNPRSEDPASIIKDMEAGLSAADLKKYIPIIDREAAIKTAITLSAPHDIILVAGKGHETYQDVKGVKEYFDDRETVRKWFATLDK
ncbi:MAG TPA: UDP-N-acetylmuramoyl-L-alanyl-D-glutamate--2,6-diaminopimelate ligase [Chitinophagaceae bacterium]|nr:UDP-N-acetylmuramoyl-L-alanyl-D-glutamate--2,6-diaminopimelate ligase [Chitinophagaceae bacterium]